MKTKKIPFNIEKAKAGAKIVTRGGYPVRIGFYDVADDCFPILGLLKNKDGKETEISYTEDGSHDISGEKSELDLLIEEEVEEEVEKVEETDNYDPYKEVIKSISDMVEKYTELQSLEDLKDFYDNVKVKCREAVEYYKRWCKNQDEKPADNKPKFQKGDWIIDKQGMVHQIIRVVENVGSHTYGYDTDDGFYIHDSASGVRLWGINDAKDGDVLYSLDSKQPFIFKHRKHLQQADVYCGINIFGKFFVDNTEDCIIVVDKYVPADKFQCERLFQKMEEEGYKWDSDKKELKKIGEEVKTRRMTNQELSWWLRDCPEEHREYSHEDGRYVQSGYYDYFSDDANVKVDDGILIRRNGGEWQEPLIEE